MKTNIVVYIFAFASLLYNCGGGTPDPEMILPGKWTVTELVLSGNAMEAGILEGSFMNFDNSGRFEEHIMGSDNPGVWKLNDDKNGFIVDYTNDGTEHETYTFESIERNKLVLTGIAHGMQRRIVLVR